MYIAAASSHPYTAYEFHKEPGFEWFCRKVTDALCWFFTKIKEIICFPLRYFGGKSAGYSWKVDRRLTADEVKPCLIFATAVAAMHKTDPTIMEKFGFHCAKPAEIADKLGMRLPSALTPLENCFYDRSSGLRSMIWENDQEVFVAFGALKHASSIEQCLKTASKVDRKIYSAAVRNCFGGTPSVYEEGSDFVQALLPVFQGKKITLVGHSFGGSLAAYAALVSEVQAVCLNPLGLGAGLQYELGKARLQKARQLIRNISVEGDWCSSKFCWGANVMDRIASVLFKTPGNFGMRDTVPPMDKGMAKIHHRVFEAMFKHAGYDFKYGDLKDLPSDHELFLTHAASSAI